MEVIIVLKSGKELNFSTPDGETKKQAMDMLTKAMTDPAPLVQLGGAANTPLITFYRDNVDYWTVL